MSEKNPIKKNSEEVVNLTTEKTKGNNTEPEVLVVENNASSELVNKVEIEEIEDIKKDIKLHESSNSLQSLTPSELSVLDYTDFSTPARMLELGKVLVQGSMCPLKKPADVVIALLAGKELGLPFIASLNEIYPINGKPTIGVHIMKSLCLKYGITYEKTRDFEDIFQFVEIDESGNIKMEKVGNISQPIEVSRGFLDEQPTNTKKRKIDIGTEYTLTRQIKLPNGDFKEISAKGIFTLLEAKQAELDVKDNWKKYPKRMLEARAFAIAGREIADDVLHGMYLPDELE